MNADNHWNMKATEATTSVSDNRTGNNCLNVAVEE